MQEVPDMSPETRVLAVGPAHERIVGFARHAAQTTFFALSIEIFCSEGESRVVAGVCGFD